jgi:peptidoglycan/xylan/chitin deacetylase (PgdA/CDA1 family)
MKIHPLLSTLLLMLLTACYAVITPPVTGKEPAAVPLLSTATIEPSAIAPTVVPVSSPTVTPTPIVFATETLEPPTALPTPVMVKQGPGTVTCPILLYHRIAAPQTDDPYYVTPDEFRAEMQALKDWGYTTIPATLLVEAINFGAKLPARPIVITFDDGDSTVYSEAYPIMREFGFTGVNYLVANYVGAEGYMNVAQIKELFAAGWEVGSHSMTHADLTTSMDVEWQVVQSLRELRNLLDLPVKTFAYPFGKENYDIRVLVSKYYRAGMGLGVYVNQRHEILYYLSRRPVSLHCAIKDFGSFLPWSAPPEQVSP